MLGVPPGGRGFLTPQPPGRKLSAGLRVRILTGPTAPREDGGGSPVARRQRQFLLVAIAAMLMVGSFGGTQVQPVIHPPFNLATAEDIGALRSALSASQATWEAHLTAGGELQNLCFKRMLNGGGTTVYWGSLFCWRRAATPLFSASSSVLDDHHSIAYLHQSGSPCELPPDQLFHGSKRGPEPLRVWNTIHDEVELAFLIFVLGGIESGGTNGALDPLASWFASSSTVELENLRSGRDGAGVWIELKLKDGTTTNPWFTTVHISAIPTPGGFDQVTVQ